MIASRMGKVAADTADTALKPLTASVRNWILQAMELFHLEDCIGRYCADLVVEQSLIVEVKTGPLLDPQAIPQLLNYLNVTRLPIGLVLFFGPKPKVKHVIRGSTSEYPIIAR